MEWLINNVYSGDGITEAVVRRCSAALLKKRLCEFFKFFKNTYFYRTPPVAASRIIKTYQYQPEIGKKQAKSNTLRLNFCFLKIIRFLHTCFHSKIVGHTLKMCKKPSESVLMRFYDKKINNKKVYNTNCSYFL